MAVYRYCALNENGVEISGEMESPGEMQILNSLTGMGYMVCSIRERKGDSLKRRVMDVLLKGKKVGRLDFLVFTRQLASLLDAGIPINAALKLLSRQSESKRLVELVDGLRKDLEEGKTISESMSGRGGIFSGSYISMVKAGETSGKLVEVFTRLADLGEMEHERREQVKSAVMYPIIILVASIAGMTFLLMVVFPTFMKIFSAARVPLPITTRTLISVSSFLRGYFPFLAVGAVCAAGGLKMYVSTARGKYRCDWLKLKLPVFGKLFRKVSMATFAHTYMALNSSGIPLAKTLEIVSKTVGNMVLGKAVMEARDKIKDGATIAGPFEESGEFLPLVVHMLHVGEESGRMDEMLSKVSEYFDKEVAYSIGRLTKLIEPALIAVMGGVIAFMYLSLITPMMQMLKVARAGGF